MRLRLAFTAATLAAALMVAGGVARAAGNESRLKEEQSHVIAFSYGIPTGSYNALYVAEGLGLFKKHGLKPTFYSFQSGAPLLAGLKSGSLDVVTTGLASVFALGEGIPIKFIVWEGDASQAEALITRRGVEVKSVKDLGKLKRFAAATGTCAQISLYWAAKAAGLKYSKLDVVNIPPPLYSNAFKSNSIDAGVAWPPYDIELRNAGYHLVGFDPEWVPGGGDCPEMTLARAGILKKYPDLGLRLVEVHAEAVKAIEANPGLAARGLVKHLHITMKVATAIVGRYFKNYPTLEKQMDPNSRFAMVGDKGLVAQLALASKTYVDLKVLRKPVPMQVIRESVDPKYISEYLKETEGR